jgi:hypothetical protein
MAAMTLIITMIRPEGIWQSVDRRVTKAGKVVDDAAPKQLHIKCTPLDANGPQVMLGFTGLAEMPDGTPTLQWTRETLRGETRTIMATFDHLRDRLTRDLGSSRLWKNPLVFSGGIFEGDKRLYAEVRNVDPKTWQMTRKFEYAIREVTEPMIFVGGSGLSGVTKEDLDLLVTQARIRPAKWEDHLGLLAAVNRRTAENMKKKTVSPWCAASFLAKGKDGVHTKHFGEPGEPAAPPGIPFLLGGIDAFEMTTGLQQHMERVRKGSSEPMPDHEEAGRRALKGRK